MKRVPMVLSAPHPFPENGKVRFAFLRANRLLVSGRDANGAPTGLAPDLASELARALQVRSAFVEFDSPIDMVAAADQGLWDVGFMARDPDRAASLAFTSAYAVAPATYMFAQGAPFRTAGEVDKPTVRIAVPAGSAYALWLTRNIMHATLLATATHLEALNLFQTGQSEAVAGLRGVLARDVTSDLHAKLADDDFTQIEQAIVIPRLQNSKLPVMEKFIEQALDGGLVEEIIVRHKLSSLRASRSS